jgi:hypothetical protein
MLVYVIEILAYVTRHRQLTFQPKVQTEQESQPRRATTQAVYVIYTRLRLCNACPPPTPGTAAFSTSL